MLPALVLIGLLYAVPLLRLAMLSFGEHGFSLAFYHELFQSWSYGGTLRRTLRISALVTLGCVLFGYPLGYVLAFAASRRRCRGDKDRPGWVTD